jgi:hypothetical protein
MNDGTQTRPRTSVFLTLAPYGVALIVLIITYALGFQGKQSNFEELALGKNTHSFYAKHGGFPIHCSDLRDAQQCLDGFRERGGQQAVLWLGNSQLHAINQYRVGDKSGAAILFPLLKQGGLDLLTFSQPNANLQEHYVLFTHLQTRLPLRLLILPLVFDDTREDGTRADVATALRDVSTSVALEKTDIGRRILAKNLANAAENSEETAGLAHTVQDHVERAINSWLSSSIPAWSDRPEMRGSIFVGLYKLRNYFFGIKATTKRRFIKSRYAENLLALQSILSRASDKNINVLMYVVPLRNDVQPPYDQFEYDRFKKDVKELAEAEHALLLNLENLVPAEYWGRKDSTTLIDDAELDFMHFQSLGHKLLADELYRTSRNIVQGNKG